MWAAVKFSEKVQLKKVIESQMFTDKLMMK